MSWGFTAAGKGAEAGAKVREQAETSKKYSQGETHEKIVDGIATVSEAFAAAFPEKTIVIESSGHVDGPGGHGYANFTAKVYH